MDESLIYELQSYLPIQYKDSATVDYLWYLFSELQKSIEWNSYSWIFLNIHLIYMTFIYIQIVRIYEFRKDNFSYAWIWIKEKEKNFEKNPIPSTLSEINEVTIFRFFRLIWFDDQSIANISWLIDYRNNMLHAKGNKLNEDSLKSKVYEYTGKMKLISKKSIPFLSDLYKDSLSQFSKWQEITRDDLEINLYIPNNFSVYELQLLTQWKSDKISQSVRKILFEDEDNEENKIDKYSSKKLEWKHTFDYSNNNWIVELGKEQQFFELMFTKASDTSIHVYNDPKSIEWIALANWVENITDITDCRTYDMTSRTRTPQEWEIIILKNIYWNYCAVKIIDVKDRTRRDDKDEVTFQYVINDIWNTDFSE